MTVRDEVAAVASAYFDHAVAGAFVMRLGALRLEARLRVLLFVGASIRWARVPFAKTVWS